MKNVEHIEVISNPNCHDLPLDNTTSLSRSDDPGGDSDSCEMQANQFGPPMEDHTEMNLQLQEDGEVDLGFGTRKPGQILPHVAERHRENLRPSNGTAEDAGQDEELLVIDLNQEDVKTMLEIEQDITDMSEDAPMIPPDSRKK